MEDQAEDQAEEMARLKDEVVALKSECCDLMDANQGLGSALAYCYTVYPHLRVDAVAHVRRDNPDLFPAT
jgi:hypothetical protein